MTLSTARSAVLVQAFGFVGRAAQKLSGSDTAEPIAVAITGGQCDRPEGFACSIWPMAYGASQVGGLCHEPTA
jgi:hypothetical protein